MRFYYYRIFLEKVKQQSLLDQPAENRQDLLYEVFNRRTPLHFTNQKQKLAFVTQTESDTYILASLAKSTQVSIQHAPEEGFAIEEVTSWPHVPLIINISSAPDTGQTIMFGSNQQIFENPIVQLRKLAETLNKQIVRRNGYEMVIHPITVENEFWEVISENEGQIKSLKFDFATPNLFNTGDKLNDELRHAGEVFNATNASVELENVEGELNLPEQDDFLKQSAEYVTKGGGEYKIKLKKRKTITSQDSVYSKEVDEMELEIAAKTKSSFKSMCDTLFLWLKNLE